LNPVRDEQVACGVLDADEEFAGLLRFSHVHYPAASA
jgi:hypothetical protein